MNTKMMEESVELRTFKQAMDVLIRFYDGYKTKYTKNGVSRFEKAPQFTLLVQRCTNWAVRANLISKQNIDQMKTVDVHYQYVRLMALYKAIA